MKAGDGGATSSDPAVGRKDARTGITGGSPVNANVAGTTVARTDVRGVVAKKERRRQAAARKALRAEE